MGITLREQGKLEYAEWAYKRALSLKPNLASTHNNLGVTFGEQGKSDKAIKSFKDAIELNPAYAEPHNNMGNSLKELGKVEEAIEAYNEALKLNPSYAEAYNNPATPSKNIISQTGQYRLIKSALSQADFAIHRNLSNMLTYTRNDEQVSQVFNFLQRADSSESDRCNLHYAYVDTGRFGQLKCSLEHYVAGGASRKGALCVLVKIKTYLPK